MHDETQQPGRVCRWLTAATAGIKRRSKRPSLIFGYWLWCLPLLGWWPSAASAQLTYTDWRLQWAEEFETPLDTVALAERWLFCYPWGRALQGTESQYYTSQMLRVQDGTLRLLAERNAQPLAYRDKKLRYTAGMLFSRAPADTLRPVRCPDNDNGFSYGLFEIRCRLAADKVSWPAFWLFGGAPDEIDVFEGNPTSFSNNVHINRNDYWRYTSRGARECACVYVTHQPAELHRQFHTYALSWLPGELVFYFDGVPIRRETDYTPLGCGMEVIVNLAMQDWAKSARDSMEIDYIRVYRPVAEKAVAAWPREEPVSDQEYFPRLHPPGMPDLLSRQFWAVQRTAAGKLELNLLENRNPPCDSHWVLPQQGRWQPAWIYGPGASLLTLALPPGAPVRWEARRLRNGELAGQGTMTAAEPDPLHWLAGLAPGAYAVQLQLGEARCMQQLYVLSNPPGVTP